MTSQRYDLVGDIHGHADALHRLLYKLEYTEVEGVFRNPQSKVIFVGDFIDRGPRQREVLRIARSMCEAGAAIAVTKSHATHSNVRMSKPGGPDTMRVNIICPSHFVT